MKKQKNIFQSKNFYLLVFFIILILGIYLRIIGLNKPSGLWYDEAWSYYTAKQAFPLGIFETLFTKDRHVPLYFTILHFWMNMFGVHDISLRFLSVIFGVLTIPVTYLAAKELSCKKVGFTAAMFVSVNSLLIYYSQEVRFYSFLALLSSLSILFLARIRNNPSKFNYTGLIISNLAIIYTFTIGFIFVFFEFLLFLIYLYFINKKQLKNFISAQLITFIFSIPFIMIFIHFIKLTKDSFINAFDINLFSYASILTAVQNWFTPVLGGMLNVLPQKYEMIFANGINFNFIIFAVIPVIICLFGLINSIFKRNFICIIFLIGASVFLVEIIAAMLGKFTILSRYTILILPVFLITASYGLVNIKNKFLSGFLISTFIFINLFYLFSNPFTASKYPRPEGYRTVANFLNMCPFTRDDIIFMPIGGIFLEKYYSSDKAYILPFELSDFLENKKYHYFFDDKLTSTITVRNSYEKLNVYLASQPSSFFENYLKKEIFNKLKNNRYFILVITRNFCPYSEDMLKHISQNNHIYKKQPLSLMLTSKVVNDTAKISKKHLSEIADIKIDFWEIYIFKKVQ